MLHLEFNSESENEGIARIVTSAYIMRFDPDMEEMEDVKTAVSEAVTNCIVHAYFNENGKIEMDISDKEQIVKIEITDHGIGIPDVKKAMEPMYTTKPEEERTGMGFSFMEAFMDEVHVESTPGHGTTVSMRKEIGWNKPLHGANVLTRGTKMQGMYSHSRIWDLSIPSRGVLMAEDVRWKI